MLTRIASSPWRCTGAVLGIWLVGCSCLPAAANQVIFEEDFTLRSDGSFVPGTPPNITNAGGAVYQPSPDLGNFSDVKIGSYGHGTKGLIFHPKSTGDHDPGGSGDPAAFNQNIYLPFDYTFGTDPVRFTMVARQSQPRWDNFVIGFTDNFGGMHSWILLQSDSSNLGQDPAFTNVQVFHNHAPPSPMTTVVEPAIFAGDFRTLVLEYDPNLTDTPGETPFSFSVDGGSVPLLQPAGGLAPLSQFGGIGFGFFFNTGIDRSVLIESLKFEILTAPEPQPGDLNGDGAVDTADYVWWRKNDSGNLASYDQWRANFGAGSPGSGSAVATSAVPEPLSAGLATLAALLLGTFWRRRFSPSIPTQSRDAVN